MGPMRRNGCSAYLLLLPALLTFVGYVLYPIVHTCLLSFYSWSTVNQTKLAVGWQNYSSLLHDPNFYTALTNNGLFIVLSVAVQLPLALLVAVGIGSSVRRHQFLRTLFFAPFVLPVVAVGLVWKMIYEPNLGAANALLSAMHLGQFASGWLGDSGVAIFAVIAAVAIEMIRARGKTSGDVALALQISSTHSSDSFFSWAFFCGLPPEFLR